MTIPRIIVASAVPAGVRSFRVIGDAAGSQAGYALAAVGDADGNGVEDLLIGLPYADGGVADAGRVTLIAGGFTALPDVDLAFGGNTRFDATGYDTGSRFGAAVGGGGDVNGDGRSDILVGAPFSDYGTTDAGHGYLIRMGVAPGDLDLSTYGGPAAVSLTTNLGDNYNGRSIAIAGDVNGDGYDDIITGVPGKDVGAASGAGTAYVVFGGTGTPVLLQSMPASQGFAITGGSANFGTGTAVDGAGDFDGDGYDDVVVGTPGGDGTLTVVWGRAFGQGTVAANAPASSGLVLTDGGAFAVGLGRSVAGIGDFDGDGYDDVIAGVPGYDVGGVNTGGAFIYFGGPSRFGSGRAMEIRGGEAGDAAGTAVAAAGDVNGDGYDDVIIGAPAAGAGGEAYVVYGRPAPPAVIRVDEMGPRHGFTVEGGVGASRFGFAVSSAGDLNADGYDEIAIGDPTADIAGRQDAGVVRVIYGEATGTTPGDATGDGLADILWRGPGGLTTLWTLDGPSATAMTAFGQNVPTNWRVAGFADATGDGKSDILWRGPQGLTTLWTLNGPSATAMNAFGPIVPTDWLVAGFADATGDGRADILWRGPQGLVTLWTLHGPSVTSMTAFGPIVPTDWKVAGFADATGDGKADILWRGPQGQVTMWTLNGPSATSMTAFGPTVPTNWTIAGFADATGDGRADILWRGPQGQVTLWTLNGPSLVSADVITNELIPTNWETPQFADATGDGKADILWRGPQGQVTLWELDGPNRVSADAFTTNVPNDWLVVS